MLGEASSTTNSQLRRRNVNPKSVKFDFIQPKVIGIQEEQEGSIMSQPIPQQEPQLAGFFDLSVTGIFNGFLNGQDGKFEKPVDNSEAVKLATRTISGDEAVLLAPALIENLEMMESHLKKIQINEIIIAAIKIKSLIPKMSIKDPQNFGKFSVCEHSNIALPSSCFHLSESLIYLINKLPKDSQSDAVTQIFDFDFKGSKTLDEFIKEKKSEIAQPLYECSVEVSRFKELLYNTSPTLNASLTNISIKLIVDQLIELKKENKQIQLAKNDLTSVLWMPSIQSIRNRIGKIIEALSEILEKL